MSHTPEKGLTSCDAVDSQSNRNTDHMSCIEKCCNNPVATLDVRATGDRVSYTLWILCLELSVGTQVQIYANVGQRKKGAGCKRDRSILVVGIQSGFGSLLPA
jgi:hypothetical protein